jgi:nucleoid-associated protein YgaU
VLGANQSSKISNRFYGSSHHYSNIADASNIADPNKIQVGEQITVPVLT